MNKKYVQGLFLMLMVFFYAANAAAQGLHNTWEGLLARHVSASGVVNYKGFLTEKGAVTAYLTQLNQNVPAPTASKNEKMAFWINAYNAATVKLILDNYPLKSIMDLDGGKTWDVKRFVFGGKKYSLNDIENTILRPMGDARVHFALNCAAKSCPPLYNKAFTADNLNDVLQMRTRAFLNDKKRTVLTPETLKISKIFDWYAADFGSIPTFMAPFTTVKISKSAKITYFDYDWRLNE